MAKEVKINLGCGYIGHPDWINIDYGILAFINKWPLLKRIVFALKLAPEVYNRLWPKNLRLIDLRKSLPFGENSVDYIFTAHFLEHLYLYEAVGLLKRCFFSLKPGGTMRVVVPDLEAVIKQYQESPDELRKVEIINNHFTGGVGPGIEPPSLHQKMLNHFARGHRWLYNFAYLRKVLLLAGFSSSKIWRRQFQQGRVPNLDSLDNHPDHSLFVEATK